MPLYQLGSHRPETPGPGRFWIAPDAHVIGRVVLADDVGVWFGSVLRGDNEPIRVGARSNVQDGSMLHTDPGFPLDIGEDCTIGHHAMLHGCTIEAGSLVGMSATIMNGARIGRQSLVGAGALVTEGKEFPERSLIMGQPAKAVRTLDQATAEGLVEAAAIYVRRWRLFMAELKRID